MFSMAVDKVYPLGRRSNVGWSDSAGDNRMAFFCAAGKNVPYLEEKKGPTTEGTRKKKKIDTPLFFV